MSITLKRNTMKGRVIRRNLACASVAKAFGEITSGCEIFALSKGQYSAIDVIEHCLAATGPADVIVATWNCAPNDGRMLAALADQGLIRSVRFMFDGSFMRREPESRAFLGDRFGEDAIRTTVNHAKFVVIENAEWNICIRTSANLNENLRMELFEVSDCPAMAGFLREYTDEVFSLHAAGESRTESEHLFKSGELFGESLSSECAARRLEGMDSENRKYLSDARYGVDVRRAGVVRV